MGILDRILAHASAHADIDHLAQKLGLDADQIEMAIASLGEAHQQEGDTIDLAARDSGLDPAALREIVEQIGGEGSLGQYAAMLRDD